MTLNYTNFVFILFLLAFAVVATSTNALAQRRDKDGLIIEASNPLKDAFYRQCVASTTALAKPESIEESCLCMSAHMKNLEAARAKDKKKQDIYSVFKAPEEVKEISKDEVLLEVYGPCVYLTVYDGVFDQCYYNKEFHRYMKSLEHLNSMCDCMATRAETYIKDYGKPRLAVLIYQGEKITDPLTALQEDIEYLKLYNTIRTGCFQTYTQHIK
jgi:hypothetical protein